MKPVRIVLAASAVLILSMGGAPGQDWPKPGPEHEQLQQLAGVWDAQVKFFAEPGKPPQESKGEYTGKMDVGGFFLATEFKGQMLGSAFHGRGLTGYDPFKKKYVGTWVDSMSPAFYHSEGAFDKSGKIYTETMVGPDPTGKPMKMHMITEIKNKDQMVFTMSAPGKDGKVALVMEVTYTRKK